MFDQIVLRYLRLQNTVHQIGLDTLKRQCGQTAIFKQSIKERYVRRLRHLLLHG